MPRPKFSEDGAYNGYKSPWGSVNTALTHESGELTDQALVDLPLMNVKLLAYGFEDVVQTELYRRPSDRTVAEKSGGTPGEVFRAPHRAVFELRYREKTAPPSKKEQTDERRAMILMLRGFYKYRKFRFLGGMFSEKMNYLIRKFAVLPQELGFLEKTWQDVVVREKKEEENLKK